MQKYIHRPKEERKNTKATIKITKTSKNTYMSMDMIIFTTHTSNHNPILDLFFCIHISQPTMTRRIHPGDLILRRYPQQFHLMQHKKQISK
ncbi:hypothetical protein YC2023_087691 [Brassica napus]